jgi:hypothetical protein
VDFRNGSVFNLGGNSDAKKKAREPNQPGLRAMLYGLTLKMLDFLTD